MSRGFLLVLSLLLFGTVAMGCEGLATDTPPLPVADTGVPEEPSVNGCGGEGELSFGTAEALPGGECGICQDGVLFCTGPDALACGAPSPPNGCGGCGLLEGEPGTSCGLCDDGQWSCGGGKVSCIAESQSNSCGGCEPLAATPGELCLLGTGEDGLTICVGRASTACVSLGRNLCGGSSALALPVGITGVEPRPGARYDDGCRSGVLYCEGEALAALDVRVPNACGGCVPLLGEPGTSCNACGAAWSCAEDRSVSCVGPKVNACGGCTELPSPLGASCGAEGGRVACVGTELLGCAIPGISNACGGLAQLAGAALGSACGECSDGIVVCDTTDAARGRTVCASASAANACGGCATLEAPPGGRCGSCGTGTLACGAAGTGLVCGGDLGDAAKNACGGCGTLTPAVGVACGRCGTTGCDAALVGQVRCVEPAAGCAAAAVCGNGSVEAGESCDDGNLVTEACNYGQQSCSVCGAACQSLAGATSYCGDRVLVADEECDDGDAIETNGCTTLCRCGTGFHAESGFCRSDVRPCLLPHATQASERWNGATYADCTASRCDAGYAVGAGRCLQDTPQPLGAACTDNSECDSGSCSTSPDGAANDRCAPAGMNYVPAGTFTMGSPTAELGRDLDEAEHLVTLTRAFFVDQTETTQTSWMGVSGGVNGSYFQDTTCVDGTCPPNVNANPDGPADQVDWYAAMGYANARSTAEALPLCYELLGCTDPANGWKDGLHEGCTGANAVGAGCLGYRLPSEAEWEFAARGGIAAATYGGDLLTTAGCATLSGAGRLPAGTPLAALAAYACNAGNRSMAVRSGVANGYGLYDMLGNVWEWTGDRYGTEFTGITDPATVPTNTLGVTRGGSWYDLAALARAAYRGAFAPTTRFANIGVRLVRSVVRSCSSAHATAATQTWTGSGYGSCVATACEPAYVLNAGVCLPGSLGVACTNNAECATGYCATSAEGTINDRCAPSGMSFVPAGTFTMGSPAAELGRDPDETEHTVTLTRAFFVDQTETTQATWTALSGGQNPSEFQDTTCLDHACAPNLNTNPAGPAEVINWYAAMGYANARSAAEALPLCYELLGCSDPANGWRDGVHPGCTGAIAVGSGCSGYRLPSEAEWEYAARGGVAAATYGGELLTTDSCATLSGARGFAAGTPLASLAVYACNGGNRSRAVRSGAANGYGLYDMLGNVWEWTSDRYGIPFSGVTDPAPLSGQPWNELGGYTQLWAVVRGGSWYSPAANARAAYRGAFDPAIRSSSVGVRLVRSITRSCTSAHATVATEAWTDSGYGSCVALACEGSYVLNAGACLPDNLGAACSVNADCAAGYCATGPDGTANDRCAPEGMNYIPADTFTMGSPAGELGHQSSEAERLATISRPFFLGQTEVRQGQWKALSGGINPSYFQNTICDGVTGCLGTENANDGGPVESLDWYAAVAFANARSKAERLPACYTLAGCTDGESGWTDGSHAGCTGATFAGLDCTGYRLPTESEWEYAARAGTTTATYGGNLSATTGCGTLGGTGSFAAGTALASLAWYDCNAAGRTQAVGGKTSNAFGLYDMLGNVWELTGDWYAADLSTVTDPTGPLTGMGRVVRGGSWGDAAASSRAANRFVFGPTNRHPSLGLRLARSVP